MHVGYPFGAFGAFDGFEHFEFVGRLVGTLSQSLGLEAEVCTSNITAARITLTASLMISFEARSDGWNKFGVMCWCRDVSTNLSGHVIRQDSVGKVLFTY